MLDSSLAVDGGFGFLTDLIGIQMRNMEAIRQAQQKMLEGIGVLAKRQTEIIEGTLRRSVSEPRDVLGHPGSRQPPDRNTQDHDPRKSGELEHSFRDGGTQRR
jgi:hypothetical protein